MKRKASKHDYDELIDSDQIIHVPGYGRILYLKVDYDATTLIHHLNDVEFAYRERTGGLRTRTESIGNKPRNARRLDVCDIAALAFKHPEAHALLLELAKYLTEIFKRNLPKDFEMHCKILDMEEILPDYLIPGTPFTSGVVNKNDAIEYHLDNGNVASMLSCMIVFKSEVTGGFLVIPQLNVAFEVSDCTAMFFDGKKLVHGVTPIEFEEPDGYRYSVVFYVREGMWKCLPAAEELDRIRKITEAKEDQKYEDK